MWVHKGRQEVMVLREQLEHKEQQVLRELVEARVPKDIKEIEDRLDL